MKIEDLKSFGKNDILAAMGLEMKRSTTNVVASSLAVFGVGLVVGAAAALLFAPKSGRDLREDVESRLRSLTRCDPAKGTDHEANA